MWITPHHRMDDFTTPWSLDDKITIFQEQTYGWQLHVADQCINGYTAENGNEIPWIADSQYAVLSIVFSYFEMFAKYEHGFIPQNPKQQFSGEYFRRGIKSIFPMINSYPQHIIDTILDHLYEGVRCGLYHAGIIQTAVVLTDGTTNAMELRGPHPRILRLYINPELLVSQLKDHLQQYVDKLHDPSNITLRSNFERRFDETHKPQ